MKRKLLNYLLMPLSLFLFLSQLTAQVSTNYIFSSSGGTYTPITGGTPIAVSTDHVVDGTSSLDLGTYAVSLPFTFNFNGTNYNSCNVNVDGNITFGVIPPTTANATPLSITTGYDGAIAAIGKDMWGVYSSKGTRTVGSPTITGVTMFTGIAIGLPIRTTTSGTGIVAGTTIIAFDVSAGTITMSNNALTAATNGFICWPMGEIRTETIGTAPNRTFIVQYKGINDYSTTAGLGGDLNFQIQLEEGGGNVAQQLIKIVYGPSARVVATAVTAQVGLRGATNADFNNRSSTTDWAATTAGTINTSSVTRTDVIKPAVGLTYTWTPNFCNASPTAGTTTASSTYVCSGSTVTFNLTGNTQGNGQTYQWQRCESVSGTFTNVGPLLTSQAYAIPNITHDSFYRCKVTCMGNSDYSTPIKVLTNHGLSGNYTINSTLASGNNNFISFNDAASALSCGVVGPVTIDVSNGPYTEQVVFPQIPGASAINTITINGNGDLIKFTPTVTGNRYIIKLDGADYLTIKNLNIAAVGAATYGWGVHLTNQADFDSILNCSIDVSVVTSTTQSNSAGIVGSNSATSVTSAGNCTNNLVVSNCVINGGFQGIIIAGTSAIARVRKNIFTHDTIKNFYETGINLISNDSAVIHDNNIHRLNKTTTAATMSGIEIGADNARVVISSNKIHDTHTAAPTNVAQGIFFTACDAPVDSANVVYNNLLYNFNSASSTIYALHNAGSNGVHFYHNTVILDHTAATAGITRGFYQTTAATDIEFYNNNIYINRGGTGIKYCLYFNTATSSILSNNNNLYIGSTGGTNGVGYYSTGYTTLAAWKAANASAYDQSSKSVNPTFVNVGALDYSPSNPQLNDYCPLLPLVTTDITGLTRGGHTEPGAFEYIPGPCAFPTAGTPTISKVLPSCAGGLFTLALTGNSLNTGQLYQWESSTISGGPYAPVGGPLNSASLTTSTTGKTFYKCTVTCPTTTAFDISTEIEVNTVNVLSAGTYTIDAGQPTSASNFQSIATAVNSLNCGTTGSVIFEIANGTYTERVNVSIIPPNPTDSIVFKSAGNDTSLVHIKYPVGATLEDNSIFRISNSKNIVFRSLSFERTGAAVTASFSTIFELDSTTGIKFYNNALVGPATYTAVNTACTQSSINSDALTTEDSTVIEGNNFIGNSNAISLFGNINKHARGTIIRNNKMSNSYLGIFLKHHDAIKVNRNDIQRNNLALTVDYYGMSMENCDSAMNISYNKIIANRGYGIKILGSNGTAAQHNKFYNNTISLDQGAGTGVTRGIHIESSAAYIAEYLDIFHNTIYLKNGSATTGNVIYIDGLAGALTTHLSITNNILNNAGIGYIYFAPTNAVTPTNNVFDRNNISVSGANISTWNGVIIPFNQKNWVSTTGFDSLSSFVPVNFVSTTDLHLAGASISNFNLATDITSLTSFDYDGNPRSGAYFYKGAFEHTALTPTLHADAGVWVIDSPSVLSSSGNNNLIVKLRNNGFVPLTSVDIGYKVNGVAGASLTNWTGNLAPGKDATITLANITLPVGSNQITAWTENTNGTLQDLNLVNDTIKLSTITSNPLFGTYSVGPGLDFANLTEVSNAIRTKLVTHNVIFELAQTYVSTGETYPITFTTRPAINAYTFTIRPALGVTALVTEGAPASTAHLIVLDSTIGFILDGRPGGLGTTSEWTIRNKQTATTYGANIRFVGGAQYDTIRYLTIESQSTTTTTGGVVFSTSTGTRGNSHNTVEYCTFRDRSDISAAAPYNAIFSAGTDANKNAYNTISNNKIYNFSDIGVSLTATGNGGYWKILNNHFYYNSAFEPQSSNAQVAIEILSGEGSEGGYTISENFIGGSAPNCGGSIPWLNSGNNLMRTIVLNTDSMAYSIINSNTIANIRKTNTGAAGFVGISLERGRAKITNNTIGRYAGNDSILCGGTSYVYGIEVQNDVGTADTIFINGNTISHLTSTGIAVASRIKGIAINFTNNVTTAHRINNNTVHHLSTMGASVGYNPDLVTAIGIYDFSSGLSTVANEVKDNIVFAISAANPDQFSTIAAGIVVGNYKGIVANNKVYGITNRSSMPTGVTTAVVAGIYNFYVSNFLQYNNMISITGEGNSDSVQLNGILIGWTGTSTAHNIYHNSISIENTTGQTVSSYAIHRGQNNLSGGIKPSISFKNNIFKNSISTPGYHFAIGIEDTSSLVTAANVNYNIYRTNNPAMVAQYGSQTYDLAGWKTRTTYDANSKNVDALFTNATIADLHLTSTSIGDLNLAGTYLTQVTKDFDGQTRDLVTPYMGADENTSFPLPVTLVQFTATQSQNDVLLNWATATETNSSHFIVERSVNGKAFEAVAKVKASGKSNSVINYRSFDENAFRVTASSTLYYRLRMVDNDGKYEYSKTAIVSIRDKKETAPLNVFPNPYSDKTYLHVNATAASNANISVVDITGKVVISYTEVVAEGSSVLSLQQSETLKAGIYFISIEVNGIKQVAKLVKQ
jgi:hypothetical protein